jgi:hypothetical protein
MNEKEYFKRLVLLFEADSVEDSEAPAMASKDKNNLDAGKDVEGNATDQMKTQTTSEAESSLSDEPDLEDADYLSSDGETSSLPPVNDPMADSKKLSKLFELYKDLLNYSSVFKENLVTIDMDLLDGEKIGKLRNNIEHVEKIIEKIRKYMVNNFPTEKYEKALYIYILLRTELLTVVKLLRESLGLNSEVSSDEQDEKADEIRKKSDDLDEDQNK